MERGLVCWRRTASESDAASESDGARKRRSGGGLLQHYAFTTHLVSEVMRQMAAAMSFKRWKRA